MDTSAWCAIEDKGDSHPEAALLFKDEIAGTCVLVTTDYVLDETYTLLLLNLGYECRSYAQCNKDCLPRGVPWP